MTSIHQVVLVDVLALLVIAQLLTNADYQERQRGRAIMQIGYMARRRQTTFSACTKRGPSAG